MSQIFIIGSLNYDLVIHTDKMPRQGETLSGKDFMMNGGGKGANQATACAKAGCAAYLVGNVGADMFGKELTEGLRSYGVHTDYIDTVEGVPTGTAVITVYQGDNRIILNAGANGAWSEVNLMRVLERAKPGDYMILQFEIPMWVNELALKKAREIGMVTVVNPAPSAAIAQETLPCIDYLVPNRNELSDLAGTDSLEDGVKRLLEQGVKGVVVTLGKEGVVYFDANRSVRVPAFSVHAVDTTAAGDTFIGYFTAAISLGCDVEDAMRRGCAASALTVQRRGAQCSIPFGEEVAQFLK